MSGTVIVASRLDMALRMYNPDDPNVYFDIIGARDLDSPEIPGWGITYAVDGATLGQFLTGNPHMAEFVTTVTQQQIDDHSDPMNTYGYELGFDPAVPPIETPPPVNRDVPYVWQEEQRMRCTMGNWENYPTSYSYQWMQDGTLPIGADNDTLPLLASNDGHSITCVVTATNAAGSTEAPPSNAVLYTAPTVATSAELVGADFNDSELASLITLFNNNAGFTLGFDIVVDGLTLKLSQAFGTVTTGQDICDKINATLGTWMTVSFPAPAAPWQFLIHSPTTGATSTIGYASAPSALASRGSVAALMASVGVRNGDAFARPTQDLSLPMRLRQSTGAITVQGIDASGT
jgi:hypothetical protein